MKTIPVTIKCKEDPDLFYSDKDSDKTIAIEICSSCPLKNECLSQAEENKERHGIWGGKDFSVVKYNRKDIKSDDPNKAIGLCRQGLHPKSEPGRCQPCYREKDKEYARRYYQKLKDTGRIKEVLGKARARKKQKVGGLCRSKKHVLTTENTMIRGYDGALMCAQCYRRVRPIVLSQEVRKKARGYN